MDFHNFMAILLFAFGLYHQTQCDNTKRQRNVYQNINSKLFPGPTDLKSDRESTPRPLLADDARVDGDYLSYSSSFNIVDYSNFYFVTKQSSKHQSKTNIIANYNDLLTENNEERTQKQTFPSNQDENTLDKVWHMYMTGTTYGKKAMDNTETFDRDWLLVKKHILPGSFMEIGGCNISSTLAQKNKTTTAIVIMVQGDANHEERVMCSQKNIPNLYVSESSPEHIQTFIEDTFSGYKILLDNLFLTDFISLKDKLLPHEYVKLLSKAFSLGKKIFILGAAFTENEESFVKSNWKTPIALFRAVCERGYLGCKVENIWGYDSWNNEDAIFSVTITKGKRMLPKDECVSLGSSVKCHANYTDTSSHLTIVHDNGSYVVSPIHTNELHLNTVLRSGLSAESRRLLFGRLLQRQYEGLHIRDDLFVSKSEIVTKYSGFSRPNNAKTSWKENPSKPSLTNKSPLTSFPKQMNQVKVKQDFVKDSIPGRKRKFKTAVHAQLGGGWERELRDRFHKRKLEDGIRKMEREDNSLDAKEINRQFIPGTYDRKDMSEEEKQIHEGLDYLQERETINPPLLNVNNREKQDDKSKSKDFVKSEGFEIGRNTHRSKSTAAKQEISVTENRKESYIKSLMNSQKQFQLRKRSQPAVKVSNKTSTSATTTMFKTVSPHYSKILIQKLLAKSHQKRKFNYQNNGNKPNRRKLMSLPRSSERDGKDVLEGYLHYTRERIRPGRNENQKHLKEETQTVGHESVNDEILFDAQWQAMKSHIKTIGQLGSGFSVFIYGTKRQSFLGSKISLLYPQANIINIFPDTLAHLEGQHRQLMKTNPKCNCLTFTTDLTPLLVNNLYTIPEMFKFQVLSLNVFEPLIHLGDVFPYYLGQILALSETTFLELPHYGQLALAQKMFSSSSGEFLRGLISTALDLVGAQTESVELLRVEVGEELHSLILKITISSITRKVQVGCEESPASLSLLPDSSMSLHMDTANTYHTVSRTKVGFSLELLNTLGLHPHDRASLFQDYLRLPVHSDMCPAHIMWINHGLKYQPITEELKPPAPRTIGEGDEEEEMQETLNILMKEITDKTFSFMDYNSRYNIGYELANRYKNSTFISLVSERSQVSLLLQRIQNDNISNIVLNHVSLDSNIMNKLLKCPDFLRYQFMDYQELLKQMKLQRRDRFDLLIGQMLATGVSTFVQVPSSKIISLATATFFQDELPNTFQQKTGANNSYFFKSQNHPLQIFQTTEETFLFETAKADVDVNVSARIVSPTTLSNGAELPWKLVRVDINKLKVQVDHHFDYAIDGHMRKYTLHCNNNINVSNNNYTVYLVRGADGFKIPYGNVNAISLIALLRLGLVETMRDKFYSQFLQLPLYEDMAPWNIVFRAGRLEYIDYDSRDLTFNKMSAAAYQIMAMLMNYKRTVQDFGRCRSKAKTAYGFDTVAECVSSDFEGPCTDIHYPVPCGDHTCRATYIDCLKALQDMEEGKVIHTVSTTKPKHGNTGMQWSFNINGPSQM